MSEEHFNRTIASILQHKGQTYANGPLQGTWMNITSAAYAKIRVAQESEDPAILATIEGVRLAVYFPGGL